ncbi:MAG: ATP-dependent Clp protease adaptor ClpS [Myxococcaceae bacterium]
MSKPKEGAGGTAVASKTETKLAKPPMYKVLLHNDDYTPRDFVVLILMHVFHRSENEATAIMLTAHNTGFAVAGVYSFEIAESKCAEVKALAQEAQFPLLSTVEKE